MVIPIGSSTPGSKERSLRRWRAAAGLLVLALSACRSERAALAALFSTTEQVTTESEDASLVTQVQMVRPAADRVASSGSASGITVDALPPVDGRRAERPEPDAIDEANVYCRQVEQQARETHAGLPKRLDRDTSATRVVAYGCDVVLEYAMHDLNAEDVAAEGVRALRAEVVNKLCSDGGARGVMNHGGSFTNVYRDQRSALIDQFTITAEACAEPLLPEEAPVSVDL
jgi:hypothetical protein